MQKTVRPVRSWSYQLQNVSADAVHACESDVVVIDAANDGERWTRADMDKMQTTKDGKRRRVIAYLSIGEAEDYRGYWKSIQGKPFLDVENPEWKGNYKVKFWMAEWQNIVFNAIDDIMKMGFDGVYLDIIDGYEYYMEKGRLDAEYDMADFVIAISDRVKRWSPTAWVVPQNGEGLLCFRQYREAIDAIGKEDIFYGADENGVRNSSDYSAGVVAWLNALVGSGKPILAVEYDLDGSERARVGRDYKYIEGAVLLITKRELDVLVCPT